MNTKFQDGKLKISDKLEKSEEHHYTHLVMDESGRLNAVEFKEDEELYKLYNQLLKETKIIK
ncbi:hypothetical protein BGM25_15940 [Bacillus sp. FJAT-29953]|nr:hypothetical protein [Bacillus sp. FJAT-29953]